MRFGIGMNTDHFEEVGQQFSVTRGELTNRSQSFEEVEDPSRSRKLRSFLDQ